MESPALPVPAPGARAAPSPQRGAAVAAMGDDPARYARRLAWLTLVAFLGLVAGRSVEAIQGLSTAAIGLYLLAYATGGYSGAVNGWEALRQGQLDVNVLMLVAAAGAAAIGEWLEGGVLLFLFSLSETLQAFALGRTRRAVRALMDLRPAQATRRLGDALEIVAVEALAPGDLVLVRPGERLPADGLVAAGESEVDQATITGESMPVARRPGDPVYASTINGTGTLDIQVTRRAEESTVARIVALVSEAQASRAPTQRVIDRFGNRYAWAVVLASLATMLLPPLLGTQSFDEAFYRAMTLLVVASPCALVISTPATYLAAIANAAHHRVLFKGGAHLETAAAIDTLAFDKTGTLTLGRPVLTDLESLDGRPPEALLALAAAVEQGSEHLIARAVLAAAAERGIRPPPAGAVRALPGVGVEARLDGRTLRITRPGEEAPAIRERVAALEAQAKTVMVLREGDASPEAPWGRPVGLLAVADSLRTAAPATLARLRAGGIGCMHMLTGDNAQVARSVAEQVGIRAEDVHAGLMPAEKVELIQALARDGRVAFVGDGVNDAPALAASSLGIAMGAGGSDVALETADVVLMGDRIEQLLHIFSLGRAARRVVRQNVAFSVGVIAVLVALTLLRGIPLPLGVIGHEGSTVLVVLNGLRLLGFRTPPAAPPP